MSFEAGESIAPLIAAVGDMVEGALLLVTSDGTVLACNRRARALLKRRGEGSAVRLAPPEGSPLWALLERALAAGEDVDIVVPRCPLSGRQGAHRLRIHPIDPTLDQGGAVIRVDEEAESSLPQALVAWRQLAAGAAHEIRNPLAGVRGFLQLLDKRLAGEEEKQYLSIIMREIDRVTDLTRQLMTIAKPPRRGRQECLPTIARRALEAVQPRAKAQGVSLDLACEDCKACMSSGYDGERVGEILLNLLHNALDAMPGGGAVVVTCRRDEQAGLCHVEVSDTGPGIPPEHLDHIFEPYFTTKATGTGLGLSLCQRFAQELGGCIGVARTAPGQGTTFRLTLPMCCQGRDALRADSEVS